MAIDWNRVIALSDDGSVESFGTERIILVTGQKGDKGEKGEPGTNAPVWGNITGQLSNQTDLAVVLSDKANKNEVYTKAETDELLSNVQDELTFDDVPTANSDNPVKSSGIKTALDAKQNTLTFDQTPTANSSNPVTSGGVRTALNNKQDKLTFDNTPTKNSTNPVTSGGVYEAIKNSGGGGGGGGGEGGPATWGNITGMLSDQTDLANALNQKQNTLTFDSTPTQNSTNPVTSGGVYEAIKNSGGGGGGGGGEGGPATWGNITGMLSDQTDLANALAGKQNTLTFDNTPTQNSNNPVKSGGIYTSIRNLQTLIDNIGTFGFVILSASQYDSETLVPTVANPISKTFYLVPNGSGNDLYDEWIYLNNKWEKFGGARLTFDNTPTANSTNPVTSGGVYTAVNNLQTQINNINNFDIHICANGEYNSSTHVPTISDPDIHTFYLVPNGSENDLYDEWIYINNAWEKFGSARIDLSDYVTTSAMNTALAGKQNTLTFDDTPTENSNNPVTSDGVKTALDGKQNTLTFDNTPKANSNNPVKSGGVYTALSGKQDTLTFDNTPKENSSNPVKSGGVYSALALKAPIASPTFTGIPKAPTPASGDNSTQIATTAFVHAGLASKQDKLTFDNIPTQGSDNPVKSGGVYSALATKQDTLTFDNVPTANSNNPVKSGGVYSALANKQDKLTFDNVPTENSDNPVKSGGVYSALALKAPIASPTFTGVPKAPTPASGDNSTQIATTAFVQRLVTTNEDIIADAWSDSNAYAVGDIVIHNHNLYKFISPVSAPIYGLEPYTFYELSTTHANNFHEDDYFIYQNVVYQVKVELMTIDTPNIDLSSYIQNGYIEIANIPDYTPGVQYSIGDYVKSNGSYYVVTNQESYNEWDSTKVVQVTVDDVIQDIISDISVSISWGQITGTLSNQTDLATALNGKQDTLTFDNTPTANSNNPVKSGGIKTALDAKAPLASPALTGTPTAPTATSGTNTTQIATTAFVKTAIDGIDGIAPIELVNTSLDSKLPEKTTWYYGASSNTVTSRPTSGEFGMVVFKVDSDCWEQVYFSKLGEIYSRRGSSSSTWSSWQQIDGSIYAPKNSPAFTGTPTAPTAPAGTNSTQIATTEFVQNACGATNAIVIRGTLTSSPGFNELPTPHYVGWAYRVSEAGTYAGQKCEVNDLFVCIKDSTAANNSDWIVMQTNIENPVTGPASSTNNSVAVFDGTTGKVIKNSGYTIATSVPANAVFTDSPYADAYCESSYNVSAKVATSKDYRLATHNRFTLRMGLSNTYQGAMTLNVNGTGAKPIYINGSASSSSNYTLPAGDYQVYYDGTNYYLRTDGKITGDITGSGSGSSLAVWGNITGTLSNQTDLANVLGEKAKEEIIADEWSNLSAYAVGDLVLHNHLLYQFILPVDAPIYGLDPITIPEYSGISKQMFKGDVFKVAGVFYEMLKYQYINMDQMSANVAYGYCKVITIEDFVLGNEYTIGDIVKYNDAYYTITNQETPNEWDSTKVTQVTVDDVIQNISPSGGGNGIWGQITGTLSDQTDLATALAAKQDTLTFDSTPTANSNNPVKSSGIKTALDAKAPLASPALTGNPTAPTQSTDNNSTRIATTAFVQNAISASGGSGYVLPKASANTLGGVKVGNNLSIDENGVLSASASGSGNAMFAEGSIPLNIGNLGVITSVECYGYPIQNGRGTPSASNIRGFVDYSHAGVIYANNHICISLADFLEEDGYGSYSVRAIAQFTSGYGFYFNTDTNVFTLPYGHIASYNGESLPGMWWSDRDVYSYGTTPTTGAEVVYELAIPVYVTLEEDLKTSVIVFLNKARTERTNMCYLSISGLGSDGRFYYDYDSIKFVVKSNVSALIDSKSDIITKSASGDVVSITDGADAPAADLIASIEPVQDLHGYDRPWPAGGGKNLWNPYPDLLLSFSSEGVGHEGTFTTGNYQVIVIPISALNYIYTLSGVNYTKLRDNVIRIFVSNDFPAAGISMYRVMNLSSSSNQTRDMSNFQSYSYMSLFIQWDSSATQSDKESCQIEAGSSATSFEPYANVCPITGFTGMDVVRTGKNFYSGGDVSVENTLFANISISPIPAGTYTVSAIIGSQPAGGYDACRISFRDEGGGNIGAVNLPYNSGNRGSAQIALTKTAYYIYFYYSKGTTGSGNQTYTDIQIEPGTAATEYEPYNGTTYPVSFESAGTVYSGTLDVITGELTVTKALYTYTGNDGVTWVENGDYGVAGMLSGLNFAVNPDKPIMSNYLKCKNRGRGRDLNQWECRINEAGASLLVKADNTIGHNVAAWVNYLSDHPLQVLFELAAPITYHLTPTEVTTLLGQNNIWADTGAVTVSYCKNTADGINAGRGLADLNANIRRAAAVRGMVTGSEEAAMIASKNYTAGKLMIVNNTLLRATANIANGGAITIGSNAEEVDLETLIEEKANQIYVAKLPFVSSASLYNDNAGFHNSICRGKDITAYLTNGSLWNRINGTNGYSLFEDLYLGDYITAGGQDYMIVDFDYYIRTGDSHDLNVHHLVMMPTAGMSIPSGTVLYNTDATATPVTLEYINTANYRAYTGDDTVSVSSQETDVIKKWNATIADPNTNTTAGGYKYSRMRQVVMKAADTIVRTAFGADHVKAIDVIYPNPADATGSGTISAWTWFKNTAWTADDRMSICDLPNELQIYGQYVWGGRAYEIGNDKWQFSLFRYDRSKVNIRAGWWLRSVYAATLACFVASGGSASHFGTSGALGVRPRFLLVG